MHQLGISTEFSGGLLNGCHLVDPLDYFPFHRVLHNGYSTTEETKVCGMVHINDHLLFGKNSLEMAITSFLSHQNFY